jgi:2-polyprenyl-3-methyl-5-hydroxy-6-metoxy-1,4-benzoquinol methylase
MTKYEIIALLIRSGMRVVDLGCGRGDLGRALVAAGTPCRLVGIDLAEPVQAAQSGAYELTLALDVEAPATWDHPAVRGADLYVFSDVLEHLRDPLPVLRHARDHLAAGGRLAVSLPNVAYWRVRLMLLRGRWEYRDYGILDRTHLRFFTCQSAEALFRDAGFRVAHRAVPSALVGRSSSGGSTGKAMRGARHTLGTLAGRARARYPALLAAGFVWELQPVE